MATATDDRRPAPMPLAELVNGTTGAVIVGRRDVRVQGVAYHSARVRLGDLFVCMWGSRDDGHRHAREAVERGAVALAAGRPLEGLEGVAQVRVADGPRAASAPAAIGVAECLGIDPGDILAGLEALRRVPGRFEVVSRRGGPLTMIDFAHTPAAFGAALPTLRRLVPGRVITVFGCAGDRDRSKRPVIGRIVTRLSDLVIVTTDNPAHEDPAEIARDVLAGAREADPADERHRVVLDRSTAVQTALALARSGDAVLLAGKGHEDCQIVGGRRVLYSDRAAVDGILRRRVG